MMHSRGEFCELFQFLPGRAAVDGFSSQFHRRFQIGSALRYEQCGGRVRHHNIAARSRFAGKNGAYDGGVGFLIAAFEIVERSLRQAEIGRKPAALLDTALLDLEDGGGAGGSYLVEAIGSMDKIGRASCRERG